MGPVDLPQEVWEAVDILKRKVQFTPILVFPDFDKPFLLETDASREGLGAVVMYSWRYGDLLHTADTYCDGLKTVGDRPSFSAGLWVRQLGVYVWSSVVC